MSAVAGFNISAKRMDLFFSITVVSFLLFLSLLTSTASAQTPEQRVNLDLSLIHI